MTDDDHGLRRVPTGVPGLDKVLYGGLFAGAVYIVRGTPGAGKTILANQICVHHASSGERALFVTLLAQSHARMLLHMEQLDFFDATLVPKQLYYVSGFRTLEAEGLKGLMAMLRHEMRAHKATILVLDGLISVAESSLTASSGSSSTNCRRTPQLPIAPCCCSPTAAAPSISPNTRWSTG